MPWFFLAVIQIVAENHKFLSGNLWLKFVKDSFKFMKEVRSLFLNKHNGHTLKV